MRYSSLAFGLLALASGCGPGYVPVSGHVKLDGKPLAGALVMFHPDNDTVNPGPGSQGKTDAAGAYSLQLMTSNVTGAVVGKHHVSITAREGPVGESSANPAPTKERVPAIYNTKSTLTFDVPSGGTTSADFELNTPVEMSK
jgi:hypothetical protein